MVRFGLGGGGESEAEERLSTAKLRDAANILLVLQSELLRWSEATLIAISDINFRFLKLTLVCKIDSLDRGTCLNASLAKLLLIDL